MKVHVLFFASLREAVATDALDVELPPAATLKDLCAMLARQLGTAAAAALGDDEVRVAVNQELVQGMGAALKAGDEVAFLPPVTGG